MKRMSEVFKLPVKSYAFGSVYVDSLVSESVLFPDVRMCIAHAVNNVDALADALVALIKLVDDKEDGDMFRNSAYKESVQVLAAYRGYK